MDPVLRLQDIRFAYPGEPALWAGWSGMVGAGITQLYGDTGSGKSTLLRVMAGELPAAGSLTLAGVTLADDASAYRRQRFFCDLSSGAFDTVTARACTASLGAGDAHVDTALWQSLVDGFGLVPHLDKPMYMLSTGSKRKVGLAAALASSRALVLLDEPTAALDAGSVRCLWDALKRRGARPGQAVVVASSTRTLPIAVDHLIALPLG